MAMRKTYRCIVIGLAVAMIALPAAAASRNPKAVAVIIGNNNYLNERVPDVAYAHRDAEAMRRYIVDVLGYDANNIIDLRDATQSQMLTVFGNNERYQAKLWSYLDDKGGSDVMVYFSGHGVPGQSDKRGYLLPVDADPDTAEINGLALDTLYANLGKLNAKSITVMLEACFSGDSHQGMLIKSASPVFLKSNAVSVPKKITVLTAAKGMQLASWDEERQHGLFTDRFLDGIYGKADQDRDGNVSIGEIADYLRSTMTMTARRRYLREQNATIIGDSRQILATLSGRRLVRPKIKLAALLQAKKADTARALEITPMEARYVVLRRVNVRAEPDAGSARVAALDEGINVTVTGKVRDLNWYRVEPSEGLSGFVYGEALAQDSPKRQADVLRNADPETRLWLIAKGSKNPEDVREYLRQYPTGRYVSQAWDRLRVIISE